MKHYILDKSQRLPISLDQAWDFFSEPKNLKLITPHHLGFEVLTQSYSEKMYAGQIITYRVSPILKIPMFWMTEITHVVEKQHFIDVQRFGPYKLWHHTHLFKEIPGGIEMRDIVNYVMPFGILGQLLHKFYIQHNIESIFEYRTKYLENRFGILS